MNQILLKNSNYICRVIRIDEDGIITEPINYEGERFVSQEIKPIPLTEDWLLKFGFNGSKEEFMFGNNNTHRLTFVNDISGWQHRIVSLSGNTAIYDATIKHVHQMQNLYFALTGEELTIKQQ